jgi:hypothetical protein
MEYLWTIYGVSMAYPRTMTRPKIAIQVIK